MSHLVRRLQLTNTMTKCNQQSSWSHALISALGVCSLAGLLIGCGGEDVRSSNHLADGGGGGDGDGVTAPAPDLTVTEPPPKAPKAPQGPNCLSFETAFQGHCYSTVGLNWMDFDTAAALCTQHNAMVASILSKAESDFVFKLLDLTTEAAWIGLRKNIVGQFVWVDKQPLSFTNWAPGAPDGSSGRCAVIWAPFYTSPELHGQWDDVPCDVWRDTVVCKR